MPLSLLPREVFYEVCNALTSPHSSTPSSLPRGLARQQRKALASLARTCRLLHEPAISALWSTVHNINILTRTLPEDLWLGDPLYEPLLLFLNLKTLRLDLAHKLNIGDEFLMAMAVAWPKLRRLEFCVDHPLWDSGAYTPSATLFGLVHFAALCPDLTILGMPIDTDTTHRIPPRLLEWRPGLCERRAGSRVYHLNVGLSVVPVPLVAFLSDVFPMFIKVLIAWTDGMEGDMSENLDGDIGTPEEIRERWEEVVFLVSIFKEVGSQERR